MCDDSLLDFAPLSPLLFDPRRKPEKQEVSKNTNVSKELDECTPSMVRDERTNMTKTFVDFSGPEIPLDLLTDQNFVSMESNVKMENETPDLSADLFSSCTQKTDLEAVTKPNEDENLFKQPMPASEEDNAVDNDCEMEEAAPVTKEYLFNMSTSVDEQNAQTVTLTLEDHQMQKLAPQHVFDNLQSEDFLDAELKQIQNLGEDIFHKILQIKVDVPPKCISANEADASLLNENTAPAVGLKPAQSEENALIIRQVLFQFKQNIERNENLKMLQDLIDS